MPSRRWAERLSTAIRSDLEEPMPSRPPPTVERRSLGETGRWISAVTISVEPPMAAPPSADERTITLLRKARTCGVITFDVSRARYPPRAERLIAKAFPSEDPELTVIVGRSVEGLVREDPSWEGTSGPDEDITQLLRDSLGHSRSRLAPVPISIVEWDPGRTGVSATQAVPSLSPFADERHPDVLWSLRLTPPSDELPEMPPSSLYSSDFSLLETEPVRRFEAEERSGSKHMLLARNTFADGRLDGSRLAATGFPGSPGEAPLDVRRMHEDFDPVLRLGFLTVGRRRTLAQAALSFVLSWSWVATTVLPLPAPERMDEVLGYAACPPISPEEFSKLGFVK